MNPVALMSRTAELSALDPRALAALTARASWKNTSRPNQFAPQLLKSRAWRSWVLNCGRGWGKTRTMVEWAWWEAWQTPNSITHAVARTSSDVDRVIFNGPSGFLSVIPPEIILKSNASPHMIVLTNGSKILGFSAEKPAALRGPQCHFALCDEIAHWQYPEAALSNLMFGLRLKAENGRRSGRVIMGTTPLPLKHIKALLQKAMDPTQAVALSYGSTSENEDNLDADALQELYDTYDGTRLGEQELHAKILDDVPGSLWTMAIIEAARTLDRQKAQKVFVGVDPPGMTAECGIVVVQRNKKAERLATGQVLDDCSTAGTPGVWGRACVEAYDKWDADEMVVETNQGGAMVAHTVRTAAQDMHSKGLRRTPEVVIREVHASKGKHTRAEPISSLYEQGRIQHVGVFGRLESQMTQWSRDLDAASPDRMDALVWALTAAMLFGQTGAAPRLPANFGARSAPLNLGAT